MTPIYFCFQSVTHRTHRHLSFRPPQILLLSLVCAIILFASGDGRELIAQESGRENSKSGVRGPVRLALFPFVRGKNVSDFEYEQISSAFHLALSRHKDFEIVPRFELGRIIRLAEEAGEKFESPEPLYTMAIANNIDLIVFGSVGAELQLQHRGVDLRTVGLKVEIVNVPRKQVFNTVAWSTSHLSGENIQEGEKISGLSTMAAGKLTWQSPDLFPIRVIFDTQSRDVIQRSADADEPYKKSVRDRLEGLRFLPGAEIDSVLVNVREKRGISGLGAAGCITLVGWLIVPFWEVDYNLDILVRVKYLDETGVQYREFADAAHTTESFHISAGTKKYERPTLELLQSVSEQVYSSIRNDEKLFTDRSELLRELFEKSADIPEKV